MLRMKNSLGNLILKAFLPGKGPRARPPLPSQVCVRACGLVTDRQSEPVDFIHSNKLSGVDLMFGARKIYQDIQIFNFSLLVLEEAILQE